MGSSSQEKGRGKTATRKRPDTGDTLGLLGNEDLSTLFASSIAAPAPERDQTAESEGEEIYNSGELDLRSMADAYFREQEAAAAAAAPAADDPVMLAPAELLIPTAEPSRSVRGLPIALVGVLGLFLIAGTVFATLMIMDRGAGTDDVEAAAQPAAADPIEGAAPATPAPAPAPVVISDPPAEPEMVFDPEPAVDKRAKRDDADKEDRDARRARREARDDDDRSGAAATDDESKSRDEVLAELRATRAAKQADEPPAPPVAAEPAPAPAPACDEVACLVNPSDPCCERAARKSAPKAEMAAASNLPEQLTSRDVNAGINGIRGRIGACGTKHGFQGVAKFKLTIAGDGTLTSASVDKGSAEFKSCVTDKLDTAKFKATQKGITVAYPFVFR